MMTSSNGNIFHVSGPLCGELTGHRWIPLTKDSDMELWRVLCLNKRLSKQSWGWWFETPSCSSWCHCIAWRLWTGLNIPQLPCVNLHDNSLQTLWEMTTSSAACDGNFIKITTFLLQCRFGWAQKHFRTYEIYIRVYLAFFSILFILTVLKDWFYFSSNSFRIVLPIWQLTLRCFHFTDPFVTQWFLSYGQ